MEELHLKHRNRMRHHYTTTSNALLYGYENLSDTAKITYQVIDSFDWADGDGNRKGFAFPSLATLATLRRIERRTVRRHVGELEVAGLLTRESRPGQPNLLIIEDPSTEETDRYLQMLGERGWDKNVLPTPDKNVLPHMKKEKEEEHKPVNEDKPLRPRADTPEAIGDILRRHSPAVSPSRANLDEDRQRREALAQELAAALDDSKSLGYYRDMAATHAAQLLWETVGEVKEIARLDKKVRKKGALFVTLLRRRVAPQ